MVGEILFNRKSETFLEVFIENSYVKVPNFLYV